MDDLKVEWGFNRWVLVETPHGKSAQRQVSRPADLAALIQQLTGVDWPDAKTAAERYWHDRPGDAGMEQARPRSSLVAAAGVSQWVIAAVILGLILLYVVVIRGLL